MEEPGFPYCGGGWAYDPTGQFCYQLRYESLWTWEEGLAECRGQGGDLASITSTAEQTFVSGKRD